ncbi:MAG: aspartate/glutamate racemase family protein [Lachnospiraceae bacterium]|nr:aspartate/glutamate racemase family protein [Lachnospiraceae bacterium]
MKIGLVYTGVTDELKADVEREVKKQLGEEVEMLSYADPSIIKEVSSIGYVTTAPAARLVASYMQAAQDGVDAILNLCSSVGEVADAVQPLAKYLGVPIVRVDEEMCRTAVKTGKRIGVMGTLSSTLTPTANTIRRLAREMNRQVEITECLVEGAFNINQEQFLKMMDEHAATIIDKVDVIVLAQGSMAYAEPSLSSKYGKPVLGSPRFGAVALKKALEEKGVL